MMKAKKKRENILCRFIIHLKVFYVFFLHFFLFGHYILKWENQKCPMLCYQGNIEKKKFFFFDHFGFFYSSWWCCCCCCSSCWLIIFDPTVHSKKKNLVWFCNFVPVVFRTFYLFSSLINELFIYLFIFLILFPQKKKLITVKGHNDDEYQSWESHFFFIFVSIQFFLSVLFSLIALVHQYINIELIKNWIQNPGNHKKKMMTMMMEI